MKHIILSITALSLVACAGSDTDLETAFCEGLEAPAVRAVNATATEAGAPDVTDARRVDINLVEESGSYTGFVTYSPDEQGSFAFGLTENADFMVLDAAGNEIPIDVTVEGATMCTALAVRHTVSLNLERVTMMIGPTDSPTIGIISEESDDDR